MSITTIEIAKLAGVSRGTVDRALHDRPGVSETMKKKILKIAEEKEYRPDPIGRALSTGKTHTIGVVLFDLEHSFFSEVFTAVENRARRDDYLPFIGLSHADPDTEKKCIERIVEREVDGLVLFPVNKGKSFTLFIKKLDIPVVTIGNRLDPSIPHVWINETGAGSDAVNHMHNKYNSMIYYAPPLNLTGVNIEAQQSRYKGVISAAKRLGMKCQVIRDKDNLDKILKGTIVKSAQKKSILGATDEYALYCMSRCRELGIDVGSDIGIMGFDNLNLLKYVTPTLATVGYPREELGEKAFSTVLNMINNEKVKDTTIKHSIIAGQSL